METVNQVATTTQENAGEETKTFTQAELDKIVGDRLSRERSKYADYESLKEKAARLDEMDIQKCFVKTLWRAQGFLGRDSPVFLLGPALNLSLLQTDVWICLASLCIKECVCVPRSLTLHAGPLPSPTPHLPASSAPPLSPFHPLVFGIVLLQASFSSGSQEEDQDE